MDRLAPDLFYDPHVVGAAGIERRGHRGLDSDRFFVHEDPLSHRAHFMLRVANRPWLFAGIVFGFGFFAVFVRQADLFTQIILGAPIFEEMVKFGLALLISLAIEWVAGGFMLRSWRHPGWLGLRLPIALAVGAGFGIMEHAFTYSSESRSSYVWRTLFHALATGTSMIVFHAVLLSRDVRTRWLAVLPSVFIHYLNNYAALVLGIGSLAIAPLATAASVWSMALVVSLGVMAVAFLVAPGWARRSMEQIASRLPVETARGAAVPADAGRTPATDR